MHCVGGWPAACPQKVVAAGCVEGWRGLVCVLLPQGSCALFPFIPLFECDAMNLGDAAVVWLQASRPLSRGGRGLMEVPWWWHAVRLKL